MPDAESPFCIGHFPYPSYPRTRILSGDITNNSVRSQNDNLGLRRVMGADLRFFCYICISISSKQTSFVIVNL